MHRLVFSGAKAVLWVVGIGVGAFILQRFDTGAGWTASLSAIATVGATFAALFIATRARTDRQAEQLATDRAQARLVLLEVDGPYPGQHNNPPYFIVHVEDNGQQPILDVALESAEYVGGPGAQSMTLVGLPGAVVPIVKPERAPGGLPVSFPPENVTAEELLAGGGLDGEGNYSNPNVSPSHVVAKVQFTDASGNRWRRSTTGLVELV
ncbi:hypothetical protein [Mycolicibacterium hippocampi]|uniref:Uncharacterized protein n=1 Tax=Mycolicibacterium hippocampi TaxID=659824 RepID=A0A7I9ZPN7_9MYCO|nr:hypothetical protein [Mycolicibacterium hippocampi]GFH02994.1 hypothetical protein MHIP_34770 [Mycolicibacterium hippocampi]